MDSRKYHLQKQIIEALKAKDNDLYSLLKSQWAHRFGVESLEELKNLDLDQLNQNSINSNTQKIDQAKEKSFKGDKAIHIKDDDIQEIEINNKKLELTKNEKNEAFKIKSYEIADKQNIENKSVASVMENKIQPKIEALIPLPPKPKYSYLQKWLLKK